MNRLSVIIEDGLNRMDIAIENVINKHCNIKACDEMFTHKERHYCETTVSVDPLTSSGEMTFS